MHKIPSNMALAITTFRPREGFIVNGGFRTFPVFGERLQPRTQIGGLNFINAAIVQCHRWLPGGNFREFLAHGVKFRRRQLRQFVNDLGRAHVFNLVSSRKIATANSVPYGTGNFAVSSRASFTFSASANLLWENTWKSFPCPAWPVSISSLARARR